MARHPRLVLPGVALHVRHRANDGQDCFRHENDRLVYLAMLRQFLKLHPCALHAYCLMTNHVHLLFTPPDDVTCALLMRDLGRCYAAHFNRRYEKWGTLWERPFRSCLVDSAAYVLRCYRYIERNPVRAGMVAGAAAFPWSSHAGNSGARDDPLLTPHSEYVAIAIGVSARQSAYRQLLNEPDDGHFVDTIRKATDGGFALIGDELNSRLQAAGARLHTGKPGPRAPAEPGAVSDDGQLTFLSD